MEYTLENRVNNGKEKYGTFVQRQQRRHILTWACETVTKRSRAARRGEVNVDDPQVKELANLPRAENTNVANSIIRTTAKNEDLLNLKLNKTKKPTQGVSKITKVKKSKFEKIDGRLSTRIERSLERSRVVKSQRKMDWNSINQKIRDEVLKGTIREDDVNAKLSEKSAEDLEIEDFFNDLQSSAAPLKESSAPPLNLFELLLDEVEA